MVINNATFITAHGHFVIRFHNGFTVSMSNGPTNYTEKRNWNASLCKPLTSAQMTSLIEVAVLNPNGEFVTNQFTRMAECPQTHSFVQGAWIREPRSGGVAGWMTPEAVLEVMNRVAREGK